VIYLAIVLIVSLAGTAVVLYRRHHQRPRTMEASIAGFARTRSAIAPESARRVTPPTPNLLRRDQRRRHRAGVDE
jgi:hypothetical protein